MGDSSPIRITRRYVDRKAVVVGVESVTGVYYN